MAGLGRVRVALRTAPARLRPAARPPVRRLTTAKAHSQVTGGQDVFIQKVRVRPRWFRPRNIAIAVGVTYFCLQSYKVLVIEPLVDWLDDEFENISQEEAEQPLEPLFIAFPFTTRMTESLPYSGSDPEWQEFVKVARDKETQLKIRRDMVGMVKIVAETTTLLTLRTGKDMKTRRYWLDVDFPYRPPPTFTRTGAEITEEGWEIVDRSVDSGTILRINRALFPSPVALSTFTFTGALLKQFLASTAAKFGYEIRPGPDIPQIPTIENVNPDSKISRELRQLNQQNTKRPETVKDPRALTAKRQTSGVSATPGQGAATGEPTDSSRAPTSALSAGNPSAVSKSASIDHQESARESLPGYSSIRSHILRPWYEAKAKYRETYRPLRQLPPRGCIFVSGLVELETARAFVLIEVTGWWNPKTKKYDVKSMHMNLKRVQMRRQAPLR